MIRVHENTLAHELGHCLGLDHPEFKTLAENKQHRSMMEDGSPILRKCKKIKSHEDAIKCSKVPALPTGEDICAINSMYGYRLNQSEECLNIQREFVAKYSGVTIEEVLSPEF